MGKRSDIDRRLRTLTDISAILRVMRTLAIMESGKLARFLPAQTQVVKSIEEAAADFLFFYPEVDTMAERAVTVRLLIGSERGLCGDFNEAVLKAAAELPPDPASPDHNMMVVGSRLSSRMAPEAHITPLTGACTVEEVQAVISRVIEELNNLTVKAPLRLTVLWHEHEDGPVTTRTLQPFPANLAPASRHSHAPILNIPPAAFYSELAEQYLFATLHEMFYQSLMSESRQRQRHIDNATRRMNQKISILIQRRNVLRQEEIIEEIETLMLSTEPEFQHKPEGEVQKGQTD